jgi:formate dehydrogenase subunit gamma
MKKGMIKATSGFERVVHWCLALSCLTLCVTGVGMMYHSLNGVGSVVGGMYNLKMLHNYTGIFFGVSLLFAIVMWWREAGLFSFPEDIEWLKAAGGYLWHVEKMPEVGKYNPGQKLFFLTVALFGAVMVATGLIIWFPDGYAPETLGLLYVLHALGYVVILPFFFVHLYLVTIGAPGSAPAMFTGWVTRGWARKQHPKWLKEMEKDGTLEVYGESRAGKAR